MPIETICSGCAKKLRVGDEHAGKQARCPQCGTVYVVPNSVDAKWTEPEELSRPLGTLSTPAFSSPVAKDLPERWSMKIDDGREFGPVERQVLDQWFAERRIGPTTQLKREGDAQWQPARSLYPALATVATAATSSTNPFAEQSAYGQFSPAVAPAGVAPSAAGYVEPHRGGLILALSLIGWFIGCFILGVVAWVMANEDLAKMRAGQMDPSGEGLTRAGQIIGILHTAFSVLALLFVFGLMFIGLAAN